MAQLPIQSKLQVEDVPDEQRPWMAKLIMPLNQFISETINAFNKQLTFQDNFAAQIKEISFTNTTDALPLSFACTLTNRPIGLLKVNIVDVSTTPIDFTAAVDITSWQYTQAQAVQINSISGLTANQKYKLTVLVF